MKYITSEEAKSIKENLVTAPFDEKNLCTDWLTDELQDYYTTCAVANHKGIVSVMCWIGGTATFFKYEQGAHRLLFEPMGGGCQLNTEEIKKRIKMCTEYEEDLRVAIVHETPYYLSLRFYRECGE